MATIGKLKRAVNGHGSLRTNNEMCHYANILTLNHSSFKTISLGIQIINKEAFIILDLMNATRPVKFLIDSGSSLDLISYHVIKPDAKINKQEIVTVTSATGHSARTVASINDIFPVESFKINHEFNIYDKNNLPICADGLLGMDFLLKYAAILNLATLTLTLHIPTHALINQENEIQLHIATFNENDVCNSSTQSEHKNDIENIDYFNVIEKKCKTTI